MLAHRRLAELQLLARRLRQVQGERTALLRARATVAHTPQQRHDTVLVLRAPSPRDARAAHAAEQLRRLDAVREALLFRRVPIALSLAERSVRAHMGVADTATTRRQRQQQPHAVAMTTTMMMDALQSQQNEQQAQPSPPQQQPQQQAQLRIARVLLLALHDAERERRCLYDEKLSQLQRRCARAQQQQLQRMSRRSDNSKHGDDDDDNKDAQAMWRAARDDVQLLQQSLLARPYMSARLWRLLLCDGAWAAAVAAQKRRQQQHEAHERDTTASPPPPLLLHMCLAFSRLTLGVLHDYVHGHTVNAISPRFAVSLPSAAQRARTGDTTRKGDDNDDTNNNNNGNDGNGTASVAVTPWSEADALFGVMQQDGDGHVVSAEVTTTAATATTTIQTPRRPQRRALASLPLRWLPPHSANVVPLMLDTLALHSFVVAELPVEALVRAGHIADVLSLFVTLQKAATALLALHYDNDNNDDAASRERLHTVLRRLEHVLLQHGVRVRDALAQQLQQASSATALLCHGGNNSSSNNATGAATTAARVLVDLDHLQLLYKRHNVADTTTTAAATTTSTTTAAVVDALQLVLFPQLRTCTRQALMARARHTALLGFATRRHRAHLLAAHGSRAGATQYLLGTVVQHARLQRRQMAAALRERYVHDAEHDAAVALARALALDDGVRLLHLCITHACDTTPSRLDGAAHTRATAPRARSHATVAAAQRRQQLQQQQEQLYATERRVAVVLLMADVVLLAASLQPRTRHGNTTRTHAFDDNDDNDKTNNNNNNDNVDDDNDDDAHMQLPLALLASVWVSLTRLWPILDSRRELQRHALHRHHRGGGGATHDETALMTALTEYVLHTINDHIAQRLLRLQQQQQQHASRARSDASVGGVVVTAADVVALATGLHDWGSVVDGGGNNDNAVAPRRPPRPAALTTLAQTTGKLVRELMLHDVALWRDVRTRSLHERQRFEQHLRTSLHTVGALDRTADTALQRICYAVA